jgi:Zn-dependent alcohol dehydrogenase
VPSHFVFKIPDEIPSEEAAPMLCGGVTVYSPLKQNGAGPGKKVGIVGIGGLGHFGLLYAKVCLSNGNLCHALTDVFIVHRLSVAKKSSPSAAPARRRKTP